MAPEHPGKASQAEFDVIQNRIALALAKRESLVKSWTASSSRAQEPTKTEAELDAEDALHFRNEPPRLGVGAPIPSHFLVSEAQQNNKSLRAKFFPTKGLKASKARDADEKAASAKRAKQDESSDEEEGRSGLGKAKKHKISNHIATGVSDVGIQAAVIPQQEPEQQSSQINDTGTGTSREVEKAMKVGVETEESPEDPIAKPAVDASSSSSASSSLATTNNTIQKETDSKETQDPDSSKSEPKAAATFSQDTLLSTQSAVDARKAKLKLKKRKEKRERKQRKKALKAKS